ncbi:MAG: hypothetical protein H5T45_02900 [Thermoplasmatales archaeon]|nr:hypothetical protein [Thermoplasmatales archaeon]
MPDAYGSKTWKYHFFNFAPLPEKISSGKMLCNLGLFLSEEAGRKTMEEIQD